MRAFIALGYALFIAIGCLLMTNTWNGIVYIYLGEQRSPAAVSKLSDYYPVDGSVLWKPIEQQAFENLDYINRENELGVRIGHFLVRDANGRRQFACQVQSRPGLYDRVELSFVGVGVSDDGKIPKMTVDSDCASEDDLSNLSPIWLPMSDIYHSEPKSQELRFPEIGGTSIHFEDLASSWPEHWSLVRVRFYRNDSDLPGLTLEPKPTKDTHLSFDWKLSE